MRHLWQHSPEELYRVYQGGQSLEQVGALEGVSSQAVRRLFRKHGYTIRRGGRPPGVSQRGRSLTPEQQAEAIDLYRQGLSLAKIAVRLGCSRAPVTRCIRSSLPASEQRSYTSTLPSRSRAGLLRCISCGQDKPRSEFYNNSTAASGKTASCKPCTLLRNQLSTYNLSVEQYQQLVASQKNSCRICGAGPDSLRNRQRQSLSIDHNHQTGQVRGLLCVACNHALGLMADQPEWLEAAAQYLRDSHAQSE